MCGGLPGEAMKFRVREEAVVVEVPLLLRRLGGLLGLLVRCPLLGVRAWEEREGGRREVCQDFGSLDDTVPVVEPRLNSGVQLLKPFLAPLPGTDDLPWLGTKRITFLSRHVFLLWGYWGSTFNGVHPRATCLGDLDYSSFV